MTAAKSPFCAICQSPVLHDEEATDCPACHSSYHADCWRENGGCGLYGCPEVPPTEKLEEMEIPVSYWGKENKLCPSCGEEILAAAIRCRHCGTIFQSAAPESSDRFQARQQIRSRLPKIRRNAVFLLLGCLLPITAPFAAVFGFFWRQSKAEELRALPAAYSAVSKIAVIVGFVQTIVIFSMICLYLALQGLW